MPVARVNPTDLMNALEWVGSGDGASLSFDASAYVCRQSGKVLLRGADEMASANVDIDIDIDANDERCYVAVPDKRELGLGSALVRRFAQRHLSSRSQESVQEMFRKKGAYSHFKALLGQEGQLDAWHEFEHAQTLLALDEWCQENGLELTRQPA